MVQVYRAPGASVSPASLRKPVPEAVDFYRKLRGNKMAASIQRHYKTKGERKTFFWFPFKTKERWWQTSGGRDESICHDRSVVSACRRPPPSGSRWPQAVQQHGSRGEKLLRNCHLKASPFRTFYLARVSLCTALEYGTPAAQPGTSTAGSNKSRTKYHQLPPAIPGGNHHLL